MGSIETPPHLHQNANLDYDVLIIGAGLSGIYSLHQMHTLGLRAKVLEAGGGPGGTWYWNRYPGARLYVSKRNKDPQVDRENANDSPVTQNPTPTASRGRRKSSTSGPGRSISPAKQRHYDTASFSLRNSTWSAICNSTRG